MKIELIVTNWNFYNSCVLGETNTYSQLRNRGKVRVVTNTVTL